MPKAKLAAASSSPFQQLLAYLQDNPSVTESVLETYLEGTPLSVPSNIAGTVASIVTQALSHNGTITFTSAQTLTLEQICAGFGFTAPTLPSALTNHISLGIISFTIDVSNPALQITGTCTGVLPASAPCNFFIGAIDDSENGWALVFGGNLQASFSNFPIIPSADLSVPLDLAAAALVVSTGGITSYTVPDSANSFANSPISFPAGGGVMIAAMLDLSNVTSGTCGGNLAYCNNPPQAQGTQPQSDNILITADLNATEATLTAALGSRTLYSWSNNSAKQALTLDLTLSLIFAGSVTIQLTSSLTVKNMTFGVSIDLTEETLLFDLSLTSSGGIPLTLDDKYYFPSNVYINSIQGLLGIDFDKCEAEVGIAAAFSFGASPSGTPSTDLVTSLLPTNNNPVSGNVPAPSAWECALIVGFDPETFIDIDLVLLSIDQVSLFDICSLLLPPNTLSSDIEQVLNGISLNNILFYWCDDLPGNFAALNLSLPGYGTALPTGFIFQGGLTWGSFSAFAGITVDSSGCSGSFSVSPFSIGSILSISGSGTGWTGPNGQTIGADGPIVEFNTTGNPYIYANWAVALLDLGSLSAIVTVTSTELDFSIGAQIGSMANASFDCQLDPAQGWFNFQCSGTFDDDSYSVSIGSGVYSNQDLSLNNSSFSASFSVSVSENEITWTVDATLQFLGLSLPVPSFTGDFALSKVEDVLTAVWHAIKASVDQVFTNVLNDIYALGKDIGHLEKEALQDIHTFADWLEGKPSGPGYLQNNALLVSDAGDVYFVVNQSMQLQWVPDSTTFQAIQKSKHEYNQNMDPVIAGLPQDPNLMIASRVDGTVLQRLDDLEWFLIASAYQSGTSGATVPARYLIQNVNPSDPASFMSRCTGPVKVAWQVNQYGGGKDSSDDDLLTIPHNGPLYGLQNGIGAIASDAPSGSSNYGSISLFIDGIRYHVGPNLWYGISLESTALTVPDIAYSAMPQYQGLGSSGDDYTIDVQQGNLYKSDQQPDIYYASLGSDGLNAGFYWIDASQWAGIWKRAAPTLIPDAFWQLLQVSEGNAYPGPSANNNYSGTNPPSVPLLMTWVCGLGTGGNGAWPVDGQTTVEYGVSFVDAEGHESNVTWAPQFGYQSGTPPTVGGYMCAELNIPTDTSKPPVAVARKIYRQFLLNGSRVPYSNVVVGTINDNYTTVWQDTNPAYNVAAPAGQLGPPDGWQGSAPVANSPVWQQGNQVQYAVTYVLAGQETQLSQWSDIIAVDSSAYPVFNNVPTCPPDASGTILGQAITRNIYRQCSGPSGNQIDPPRLVGQIKDNSTVTFCDNVPTPGPYTFETWCCDFGSVGGGGIWPSPNASNYAAYGISFVNGAMESTITWGSQMNTENFMCAELDTPMDNSNPPWATALNVYRQFFDSSGNSYGPPELVGTINDNSVVRWQDLNPAYNIAAPPQLRPPNNQYWGADAPIANSQVWQEGNIVQYAVSYYKQPGGETQLSEWSAPIGVSLYAYPYFDSVPICPTDTDPKAILYPVPNVPVPMARNIYRMCTGPGGNVIEPPTLLLPVSGSATTIPDNTTTIFHDWTS